MAARRQARRQLHGTAEAPTSRTSPTHAAAVSRQAPPSITTSNGALGLPAPKTRRISGPNPTAATISGMTMKKLNTPMYTPIRWGGTAVERMAYGMERMDAHAMPTPTMLSSSRYLSWMRYTDNNPTAPHSSAAACTVFRLVTAADLGSANATTKQVIE